MTSTQKRLRTGQRVILQGLEKARELNGHRGVVVRYKEDLDRYAVRVAGKEMAVKVENLKVEGGAQEAEKFAQKHRNIQGSMYNPAVYARTPGAGPKMTQWIGQLKVGQRCVVRADTVTNADEKPIGLWFGDAGFVRSAAVDVACLIGDVGADAASRWQQALTCVLGRFPVVAGRLRQSGRASGSVWQIVVNNAGVPLTTATVPICGLPAAEELQRLCMEETCAFFDPGDPHEVGEHEPLLRMKLIVEEGSSRGLLGLSFSHVLCDIVGLSMFLRSLEAELEGSRLAQASPCFDRALADKTLDAVVDATAEEEAAHKVRWPLWPRALERWSFLARKLRSGLRGKPDGVATVSFTVPEKTVEELKHYVEEFPGDHNMSVASSASSFEVLVCYLALQLLRLGRKSRRVLVTKDFRPELDTHAPGAGLSNLFANVVTHGLSFQLPEVDGLDCVPLADACTAMRDAVKSVTLGYVQWHRKQDHYKGLPNFFGGLCCNTWGRALADIEFIEAYALGPRSIDERAANMAFPLDAAYMQLMPQRSGQQQVLLTMPVTDIVALLGCLPSCHFGLPHVSELRTHVFKTPLPPAIAEMLCPLVETKHHVVRVACIGDSITACGYPKELQTMFDKADLNVQVRNFGVTGATATRFADEPYWDQAKYHTAQQWRPHIVVATFGTNDAKESTWEQEVFEKDYKDLCVEFLECIMPRPVIFLVVPPPLYVEGAFDIQQEVVLSLPNIIPNIAQKAERSIMAPLEAEAAKYRRTIPPEVVARTAVIDAFGFFGGASLARRCYMAADGVHPNERGTKVLTRVVYSSLCREVRLVLARAKTPKETDAGFGL